MPEDERNRQKLLWKDKVGYFYLWLYRYEPVTGLRLSST